MRVLGVNFGHSAAAAYVQDGQILAAIEEDKLSRIKGEHSFPKKAIAFIFKKYALKPQDIDAVAIGCTDICEFGYGYRQLNRYFGRDTGLNHVQGLFYDGLKRYFPLKVDLKGIISNLFYKNLALEGFPREKIILVDHHEAHAASAYYTSPWQDAAVMTNDGKGDGLCGTLYIGRAGRLERLDAIKDANSVGQFYQSVTKSLGYKANRHEGKITGLAAFGDPAKTFALMNKVFSFEKGHLKNHFYDNTEFVRDPLGYFERHVKKGTDGFIHPNYLRSLNVDLMRFAIAYQMYINYLHDEMGSVEPKDVAAGIQKLAEDALVAYVKAKQPTFPSPRICLAGGVFANVKINQRIREIPGINNVYIQPAMDDAGTSLGAALVVWMRTSKEKKCAPHQTVYLGPSYTDQEIEASLRKHNLRFKKIDQVEQVLGRMIYEGKIIGRYNGALEWGPRALGNRSIIARPIQKDINDTLNVRLRRTEFMPFAPSMLDEDAPLFLQGYSSDHIAAKYMTVTYDVKPAMIDRIQAAVHIDGTARPQVVTEKDNPTFYRIIKEYKKHSGFGVVINTSFNMHEEPIVDTPEDAIRSYLDGAVDVLSLGTYLVEREN